MTVKRRENILPNTYIPVRPNSITVNILQRLPRHSLVELVNKWPKIINTQPHLNHDTLHQRQWNKVVLLETSKYRQDKTNKRKIIDKILLEFWSNGLNLLQLSQIDCQLIVDKPNSYSWISSIVKDSFNNEIPLSLDPKKFLDMLAQDLNFLFMTHIYVCKHPRLPLIIIRIQVFDLQTVSSSKNSNRPHITSHRQFFLAIPLGSPYIIHSPGKDVVSDIVMQVVQRNLPQKPNNLVTIHTDPKQKPVKSLEAMYILHGNVRFGNSLGAWSAYADLTVDMPPLTTKLLDSLLHPSIDDDNKENDPLYELKKIANLRFKGSKDGKLKSQVLYQKAPTRKKRKLTINTKSGVDHSGIEHGKEADKEEEEDDDEDQEEYDIDHLPRDEFSSLVPVQNADFLIQEPFENGEYSNITVKLTGPDIFAGLHQLSVATAVKEDMILDPSKIPSWLTGEEGRSSGTVKDGIFRKT